MLGYLMHFEFTYMHLGEQWNSISGLDLQECCHMSYFLHFDECNFL